MDESNHQKLLLAFQSNPDKAFPEVFDTYYPLVCNQVYSILGLQTEVEDVAQEIFYELWKKRYQLKIKSSLPAYLKKMASTRSLNHIRDKKMKWSESDDVLENFTSNEIGIDDKIGLGDLENRITKAIDALPPKCRTVFTLSRFEDIKNKEIAAQLDISIKTVENQITRALKGIKSAIGHNRYGK